MTNNLSNTFAGIGVSLANAAKAISALSSALGQSIAPSFDIERREDGYLITCYNPGRIREIKDWFDLRGYVLRTVNGHGWHVYGVDADTAVMAKLTFGGAA